METREPLVRMGPTLGGSSETIGLEMERFIDDRLRRVPLRSDLRKLGRRSTLCDLGGANPGPPSSAADIDELSSLIRHSSPPSGCDSSVTAKSELLAKGSSPGLMLTVARRSA